jgi:hypothetical protein
MRASLNEYSQPAGAMFQFHEEYPIFVGRLESRDVLLANVHRRGSRVLEEHDIHQSKSIGDVG